MQPSLFNDAPNEPEPVPRTTTVVASWTTFPPSVLAYLRTATYMRLRTLLSKLDMAALEELDRAVNDEVLDRYRPAKRQRVRKQRKTT